MATDVPQAGKRPISVLWGGLLPSGGVVIPGGGLSLLTHGVRFPVLVGPLG